jgi:two-component system chemotaxis response regulator CheB
VLERRPIRVLVVDDSAVARKLLSAVLSRDPEIEVVATAADGAVGLQKLARFRPDVVTLDLEMPRMGGLDVLRRMTALCDAPVLVVSAHTPRDAELTATALSMGAVDVVAKPPSILQGGVEAMAGELMSKIRAVAGRRWRRPAAPRRTAPQARSRSHPRARRAVALAASTGGPAALADILPRLPADFPAVVLVVQHMPEGFTEMLAQRLDQTCALPVREAHDGEPLRHAEVLIAPAGRHMRLRAAAEGPVVQLGRDPPVAGHRPSADILFASVALEFGAAAATIAQDEDSSVVFGMPRAAIQRGVASCVLPVDRIAAEIVAQVTRQARRAGEPPGEIH